MRLHVKQVNRFFLLATAPFIGILLCLMISYQPIELKLDTRPYIPIESMQSQTNNINDQLMKAQSTVKSTLTTLHQTSELYQKTLETTNSIVLTTKSQVKMPEYIYNRRVISKLGTPYETVKTDRISIELFKVNPGVYRGYAMKVKLKDPSAMSMSLGKDTLGGSETTLQAVRRKGAIAGINAGGYADDRKRRYPLSTTVLNGQYLTGFEASYKNLAFVGMNSYGKLIGGKFYNQKELDKLKPKFGATFVPVLLQNGQKMPIPIKWQTSPKRAPRTIIGNYKDDQLLILVIDGYDENGGSGATLQEIQNKLLQLGVRNAYNLDGGGSSSLILNGRVINKPSDGALRSVPTHFLFFK
ncbi:phosphodiester glycosidase family protein [Paenibacillus crassostreae]|uniref:Exopolysaccharide biosynthesis protein n=1 Tax=Paenibacillus crassostreae TaxID=1763538 RepID=A0A167GSL8_9BACL|nr:phosphodiester glycosidase family protein [Paenibacillus crassostreae]AOZ92054.1 exopolysaccharide biosynthesis protein [Paenibacillus crassostreae]OAB77863.1 exopolysaccharide biosynthesis protein [Paenibacillus crassostreae]